MGLVKSEYWLFQCDTCGATAPGGPRADPDRVPGGWERADAGQGDTFVRDQWIAVDVPTWERRYRCGGCRATMMAEADDA